MIRKTLIPQEPVFDFSAFVNDEGGVDFTAGDETGVYDFSDGAPLFESRAEALAALHEAQDGYESWKHDDPGMAAVFKADVKAAEDFLGI